MEHHRRHLHDLAKNIFLKAARIQCESLVSNIFENISHAFFSPKMSREGFGVL